MERSSDTKNVIYMDHAATTFCVKEAYDAMQEFLTGTYGNPASIHFAAREAAKAVRSARQTVAASIGADTSEIIFTSGGSESDNQALFGATEGVKDAHVIVSSIEHHAVLNAAKALEKRGVSVTYLPVDRYGTVDPDDVKKAIKPNTVLVSVMFANNEIGTIEPIGQIGRITRSCGVLFHTDAVQAYGHIPIDVKELNIDILSASGHKMGAPKGVGFTWIRNGVRLSPLIYGGMQERGLRGGTLNVPGIVALGAAADCCVRTMDEHASFTASLRDMMIQKVTETIPDVSVNGHPSDRLPGNVSLAFSGVESETLLILLDKEGICASGASACSTGAAEPSHVLMATGLDEKAASSTVRFSLSYSNTPEEIDRAVSVLAEKIKYLRQNGH